MKKIRFILNPISGVGKKDIIPQLIKNNLDHTLFEYELLLTSHRGHAIKLAKQAADDKIDIVAIIGGDGSVNEAAQSLIGTETTLAIIPAGSGNGVARHLRLPQSLGKAIERINEGKTIKMDTVTINNKPAIGVSGFGFDADIAKRFDEYHKRGLLSYAKLVLKEWKSYKGFKVILNDEKEYTNLMFCSVANTSQFGNDFYVSPESDVEDGKIELVFMKLPSTLHLFNLLLASLTKSVHKSEFVEISKVKSAKLTVESTLGHIDGDPIEFSSKEIQIKCVPQSLKVIV